VLTCALGACSGQFDIAGSYSPVNQLVPAHSPEVKMAALPLSSVLPCVPGKFCPIVYQFGTARSQGGADSGQDVQGIGPELGFHRFHTGTDDVGGAALPPGMDIGGHTLDRVVEHHRLAVRRLDKEEQAWNVRNRPIGRKIVPVRLAAAWTGLSFKHQNPLSVGLVEKEGSGKSHGPGNGIPVFQDQRFAVANAEAHIEGGKGRGTEPPVS